MRSNAILHDRAKYFFEMATYQLDAHPDLLKKDLNLRLAIGYTVGQALELTLKQILSDLINEYTETHKIIRLCDELQRIISKPNSKISLIASTKLKQIINEIEPNAKIYGDLAYGARYIADLRFSKNQLDELIEITKNTLIFYNTIDKEV